MQAAMRTKQIISVTENGENKKLHFDEENLRDLLSDSDPNSPVVVLSVTGAYRTGKSFLLNSMVRYLTAPDKTRWLDHKAESFEWRSGSEPHTAGMVMSQPMPITLPSGEEALLILLDTQGLFDASSNLSDSTKIFVLSTLVSSLSVFNLMQDLKGSDLEHLQLFAGIGSCAMESVDEKPFQDFLFLIRDWRHRNNYPLGSRGGKDLVEKRLNSTNEGIARQREEIRKCFTSVSGFLLPYPGETVAETASFECDAKDMKPDFVEKLGELMEELLTPAKMSVKMMGGFPLTCAQMVTVMKTCFDRVQSDSIVKVDSIIEALSEAENMAAVYGELERYGQRMDEECSREVNLLDPESLKREHESAKAEVLESFRQRRTIRDPSRSDQYYYSLLEGKIDEEFSRMKRWIQTTQAAAQEYATKAKNALDESIAVYHRRVDYSACNPLQFVPGSEESTRAAHVAAMNEALNAFEEKTIQIPEDIKRSYKLALKNALDELLYKAMGKNTDLQMIWIGFGKGLLIGPGIVELLSPESELPKIPTAIGMVVGVAGAICLWYWWQPITAFFARAGACVANSCTRLLDGAGRVLAETVSELDPEVMASVLTLIMSQHRNVETVSR